MTRWLISVPVWGERNVEEFCAASLPSLTRSIERLRRRRPELDLRLVVHTDMPDRIRGATSIEVDSRSVPAGARDFDSMSQAHREILRLAMRGDVVVLFTGGAVISDRGLEYCWGVLENPQKKLLMAAVPRVLARGRIPDTSSAPALMRWAWDNRHPMVDDCTWPHGRSRDMSRTYFAAGSSVNTLQALPHPLAIRMDGRTVSFTPTVDANLMHCYDTSEIHLATDCQQLAVFKLSPDDKVDGRVEKTMEQRAADGELVIGNQHQRWCLNHRIALVEGDGDPPDGEFLAAVRER